MYFFSGVLTFSYFYKVLFVLVTPKKQSVTPHYSETDAMSSVFSQKLLVSSGKAVQGKLPQQTLGNLEDRQWGCLLQQYF